jgi:transcriptional antiterminator NusG
MGEALPENTNTVETYIDDSLSWFAVQTRTRYEKKVASDLAEKGVTVFLPLVRALHQWSDRKREVALPLFSHYVFVHIRQERTLRSMILSSSGVVGFVGMRGDSIAIPEAQIQAIRTIVRERVPFTSIPFVNIGQKVRIRGGCLDGIEGEVLSIGGDQSLVVSVDGIQKSLAIRISGYQLDAA